MEKSVMLREGNKTKGQRNSEGGDEDANGLREKISVHAGRESGGEEGSG